MLQLVIGSQHDSSRNHHIMAYTTFKYANVGSYGYIIRALCSKFGRRTERLINNHNYHTRYHNVYNVYVETRWSAVEITAIFRDSPAGSCAAVSNSLEARKNCSYIIHLRPPG